MNDRHNAEGPASVKFWFWRTSRGTAVAMCLALFVASIACAAVVLGGVLDNRWLYLVALLLAIMSGQYMNAIRRADRYGG